MNRVLQIQILVVSRLNRSHGGKQLRDGYLEINARLVSNPKLRIFDVATTR
jgi:hypothetical protein